MLFSEFSSSTKKDWEKQARRELTTSFSELQTKLEKDIVLQPIYTNEDLKLDLPPLLEYAPWINLPACPYTNTQETKTVALYLLEQGADGCFFDLTSQNREVVTDFLQQLTVWSTQQAIACRVNFSEKQLEAFSPIASRLHRGFIQFTSLDLIYQDAKQKTAYVHFLNTIIPKLPEGHSFQLISISETHHQTVVEQIAYHLALAIDWIDQLTQAGMKLENVLNQIVFSLPIHSNYFLEITKLRAIRLLWQRLIEQGYGLEKSKYSQTFIHAINTACLDTPIENNIIRHTIQAMAAVLGGCTYLSLFAHDQFLQTANPFSYRLSAHISSILKEEAYFDKVIDPSRGSFFLENLTHQLVEKSWNLLKEIEQAGGYAKKIQTIQKTNKV